MNHKADRVMYIGTTDDLYRVELNGSAGEPQALGLRGKGGMRGPAVVDRLNPRRIYAGTGQAGVFRSDDEGQTWQEANQGIIYKEIWWMNSTPPPASSTPAPAPPPFSRATMGAKPGMTCHGCATCPRQGTGPSPALRTSPT